MPVSWEVAQSEPSLKLLHGEHNSGQLWQTGVAGYQVSMGSLEALRCVLSCGVKRDADAAIATTEKGKSGASGLLLLSPDAISGSGCPPQV